MRSVRPSCARPPEPAAPPAPEPQEAQGAGRYGRPIDSLVGVADTEGRSKEVDDEEEDDGDGCIIEENPVNVNVSSGSSAAPAKARATRHHVRLVSRPRRAAAMAAKRPLPSPHR